MTLNQIKYLRDDLYGTKDLFIFCSDAIFYDGSRTGSALVWDDEHEIVHAVRISQDYRSSRSNPVDIRSVDYSIIEFVSINMTQDDSDKFLDKLVSQGKLTSDKKDQIIETLKDLITYKPS